jgi:hypothetical protein
MDDLYLELSANNISLCLVTQMFVIVLSSKLALSANSEQRARTLSRWSRGNISFHLATPQVLARKYNNFSAV